MARLKQELSAVVAAFVCLPETWPSLMTLSNTVLLMTLAV